MKNVLNPQSLFLKIYLKIKIILIFIKKFKNQKWSNIIKNKTDLDNFYKIKNFNLKEIKKN